jgi:hypothetical protein
MAGGTWAAIFLVPSVRAPALALLPGVLPCLWRPGTTPEPPPRTLCGLLTPEREKLIDAYMQSQNVDEAIRRLLELIASALPAADGHKRSFCLEVVFYGFAIGLGNVSFFFQESAAEPVWEHHISHRVRRAGTERRVPLLIRRPCYRIARLKRAVTHFLFHVAVVGEVRVQDSHQS